jgi:hypothetical protein
MKNRNTEILDEINEILNNNSKNTETNNRKEQN